MKKFAVFVPLALFVVLSVFLFKGLDRDPSELPSALVGEPFPEFFLPQLLGPQPDSQLDAQLGSQPDSQQDSKIMLNKEDLVGQVVLVNVWATWCFACRIEHPMLNDLAKQGVKIVGLNYKDQRSEALKWLKERGNPYLFNIFDAEGSLGFDLGVYGAPETYLVDVEGIIRHRRVGVVDQRIWDKEFRDLYQQLLKEAK